MSNKAKKKLKTEDMFKTLHNFIHRQIIGQ